MTAIKQRRFTVAHDNGWLVINRTAGIYPRCVFSTAMSVLPQNPAELRQWIYGLICRIWWDVTDEDGHQGAVQDADEIATVIERAREKEATKP